MMAYTMQDRQHIALWVDPSSLQFHGGDFPYVTMKLRNDRVPWEITEPACVEYYFDGLGGESNVTIGKQTFHLELNQLSSHWLDGLLTGMMAVKNSRRLRLY